MFARFSNCISALLSDKLVLNVFFLCCKGYWASVYRAWTLLFELVYRVCMGYLFLLVVCGCNDCGSTESANFVISTACHTDFI